MPLLLRVSNKRAMNCKGESMTQHAAIDPARAVLLRARDGLILHQALYAAAKLGVADHLGSEWASAVDQKKTRSPVKARGSAVESADS